MITYKTGDIFSSSCDILVNPVNCVGVMGKGLALSFKKRDPEMFISYKEFCDQNLILPGILYLKNNVLNFPTKKHWRDPSTLKYIELGLDKFIKSFEIKNIRSIAFPRLGCDNGGLVWSDVEPLMLKYLENLNIDIEIWEFSL